jgi:hypothetical protein
MQILLSFFLGYFVGAKAGSTQFDEVVESARAVAESEEFRGLLLSLRSHAASTLHALGDLVEAAPSAGTDTNADDGVVDRVRRMMEQARASAS